MLIRRFALVLPVLLGAAALPSCAAAGDPRSVEYTVRLPAPHTQMVDLSVELHDVNEQTVDLALPIWRPGRYVVLNHSSSVREVAAFNGDGAALPIDKIDKASWRVHTGGAEDIRVDYRIYANSLRDRTRHVDDTHAFLSGSSVFLYNADRRDHPVTVHIDAPDGWTIASGLDESADDARTLLAPNYDVLVDSPIEIGRHVVIDFTVGGKPHQLVIWGEADYDRDQLVEDLTKIVEAQAALFGEMPYDRYVFILHVGQGIGGGTEHLNSTIMQTSRRSLEDDEAYPRFLGLVSHEFFHTWNVKQFRPAGIHPYDYQTENYTSLLWVCEGTTSYYDDLILARVDLTKSNKYLKSLGDSIGRYRDRPGRFVQSLAESSFDAWVKFGSAPDDVNSEVSFYSKGALVSLLLDMEVRRATDGRHSLDDVMRAMYQRFPLSGPGYTPQDLIDTTNAIMGGDISPYFDRYVTGADELDLESAFEVVGVELYFKPAKDDDDDEDDEDAEANHESADSPGDDGEVSEQIIAMKAYLGLAMSGGSVRSVRSDSPAYDAGFQPGDELIAIDGRRVTSGSLDDRLKKYEPGDQILITMFRGDELRELSITLAGKPDGKWTLRRVKEPTEAQIASYQSWIGQDWPKKDESDIEESASANGND